MRHKCIKLIIPILIIFHLITSQCFAKKQIDSKTDRFSYLIYNMGKIGYEVSILSGNYRAYSKWEEEAFPIQTKRLYKFDTHYKDSIGSDREKNRIEFALSEEGYVTEEEAINVMAKRAPSGVSNYEYKRIPLRTWKFNIGNKIYIIYMGNPLFDEWGDQLQKDLQFILQSKTIAEMDLNIGIIREQTNTRFTIKSVQRILFESRLYEDSIDGKWSQSIEKAIIAYQQKHNLPPSGKIDEKLVQILELQEDPLIYYFFQYHERFERNR